MDTSKRWKIDRARPDHTPFVYSFYRAYINDIRRYTCPTPDEERELGLKIRAGDEAAIQTMIVRNLRLVECIAHDYEGAGLSLFDLISEGNIGLMVATSRFDPDKGKFSTYAGYYIKQCMLRALCNQSRTIRIPVHMLSKIALVVKTSNKLRESFGRQPTDEELALELGVDVSVLLRWQDSLHSMMSLDAEIQDPGRFGRSRLGDTIPDPDAEVPGDRLMMHEDLDLMRRFFPELEEREQIILKMRYGLPPFDREHTLEEVGQVIGLTRERVRQIQEDALDNLLFKMKKFNNFV